MPVRVLHISVLCNPGDTPRRHEAAVLRRICSMPSYECEARILVLHGEYVSVFIHQSWSVI